MITMDLRFAAFVRITRDAGLRSLLVNHADRIDHDRSQEGPAPDACFLALRWTTDHRTYAPAGSEVLTACVHLPLHRRGEYLFLDFVLERLRAALAADTVDAAITTRCLGTSRAFVDSSADTIAKRCTFVISPAGTRPAVVSLPQLAPWIGDLDSSGRPADFLASAPSLN